MTFGEEIDNSDNRYKYNGKELDRMHGLDLYDYGARHYDAAIGRWGVMDPLAEKFPNFSPYVYCYNNSVRYIDLDGRYGSDGHYWTVYAMAVSMGLSNGKAIEFALHAENYDNVVSNVASIQDTSFDDRYTWANPLTQGSMHGLTGGSQENVNFIANIEALNGNPDAIHLLGDSYSHATAGSRYTEMYSRGMGHLGSKDDPDNIAKHPGQYNKYLDNLQTVIGLLSGSNVNVDRTVFSIISKNGVQQERSDILKGFIASKVGQIYTTISGSKNIVKAFDQLGISYTINTEKQRFFFGLFQMNKHTITINGLQK